MAAASAALGQPVSAARVAAAADVFSKTIGATLIIPHWQADFDQTRADAREALGPAAFEEAWAAGQALPLDRAIDFALHGKESQAARSPSAETVGPEAMLTPREREVVALIAQGLADRQIADALIISLRTAENHVHHILAKLGLHSRGDLLGRAS